MNALAEGWGQRDEIGALQNPVENEA